MNKADSFFTSLKDLYAYLELPPADIKVSNSSFSFLVSRHFASKIQKGDLNDPLLHEILPREEENLAVEGFSDDPVGDLESEKEPGILQKYEGRALIEPTPACSLHCRFCFRRGENLRVNTKFVEELEAWLAGSPEIHELILSGGDPLMLSQKAFNSLVQIALQQEPLRTIRIHTRLPISLPSRILKNGKDSHFEALQKIAQTKKLVFVSHVDHPNELDESSKKVFAELKEIGATLLNQTTLLKGVNDSPATLVELSFALFNQGVLPYYLHQLDHATGVAHFEVPDTEALEMMEKVRNALPGYLVPRFVREITGEKSKHPLL
ncbi:MAG: KamA family radical SAM protein [Fibrobacteraceae bacterium]|nr:KamA family radical SAM protein [Fibrobacteraceae bacterium]